MLTSLDKNHWYHISREPLQLVRRAYQLTEGHHPSGLWVSKGNSWLETMKKFIHVKGCYAAKVSFSEDCGVFNGESFCILDTNSIHVEPVPLIDYEMLFFLHRHKNSSPVHGYQHWMRVAEYGLQIAVLNGADRDFVLLFAAFHDAFRMNEGHDPSHGERASERLLQCVKNKALGIDQFAMYRPTLLEKLAKALVEHDRGFTTDDPNIGACWDADRLELRRLGMRINPNLLSTEAGKSLI